MLCYLGLFFYIVNVLSVNSQKSVKHENLFHLSKTNATEYEGGSTRQAYEMNFPILKNQFASMVMLTLKVGGIRQPHWHPFAWELNFVMSGTAEWGIVGTNGQHDSFIANAGDLVFIPVGVFHYFSNADSEQELKVLVIFNSGKILADDDIGIVPSLNGIPVDILAASFGMPNDYFHAFPRNVTQTPIILRKNTKR
ncbi:unnamed protein product [Adineta steineri]|uniref:Cupin type-1 domain-containing protein n=1 Tax=Adineta steineri TaxID=433720 RepID=A0A814WNN2_9BILA|nr:unnamed protein product [Adineta steineri]CAF1204875.1 unnamed protein product [Adineta steineri]